MTTVDNRTRLALLGVGGGPGWTRESAGIASAVVAGGDVYLIDCGEGVFRQYLHSGIGDGRRRMALANLRAVFLTHLHGDHTLDYPKLWTHGLFNGLRRTGPPVEVHGPGNRGSLPAVYGSAPAPVVNESNPTPGTSEMTEYLLQAFAQDVNDRLRDNRLPDVRDRIRVHDIPLPAEIVAGANENPAPPLSPFPVYEDENVRVSATLVDHRPMFPAFGFRFDTADGSVVFSGDTAVCDNLVTLAAGADVLVHEVIDLAAMEAAMPTPRDDVAEATLHHLRISHTSIEQVGGVAEAAGVRKLVLNHFVPAGSGGRWHEAGQNFSGELIVGEDLRQVDVGR